MVAGSPSPSSENSRRYLFWAAPPKRSANQHVVRCAIYTRKSTTVGLDDDFTTLDAQREACDAYIQSQKHAGWRSLPTQYDDGGFTGATLDRPALKHLLEDMAAGLVDCVVVYKVDRLSRSLLDFTLLLDRLDRSGVAFVSVTQHFNTESSMGRLTLNILLSFAQFEREMIGERIRDKMGAARRRGKYMGGVPPLGYDVDRGRKCLIVQPAEAVLVRTIFTRYLHAQSLLAVVQWLTSEGYTTKRWTTKAGKVQGGRAFTVTRLQALLRNPLYVGQVRHGGEIYDGEQEAIVAPELFTAAQDRLTNIRQARSTPRRAVLGLLARGLVQCTRCQAAMAHTYSQKNNRRYRSYVCTTKQKQGMTACAMPPINAAELEQAVVTHLRQWAGDPAQQRAAVEAEICAEGAGTDDAWCVEEIQTALGIFEPTWDLLAPGERARVLAIILERVDYDGKGTLGLTLSRRGIQAFGVELGTPREVSA